MNERTAIIFSSGLISLQIIIKILKKFIKQPRPSNHLTTYGMPSTRSSVFFYIITLFLLLIKKPQFITIFILISIALISSEIKYVMKEHTFFQLTIGGMIGVIWAFVVKTAINN